MKIGIAGMGVVGKAVYHAFSPVYPDIKTFDVNDDSTSVEDLFECDYIFICVPAEEVEGLKKDGSTSGLAMVFMTHQLKATMAQRTKPIQWLSLRLTLPVLFT